jgi:hypothetical protein
MAQLCKRCTNGNLNGKCSLTGKFTYEISDKDIELSNYACFKERIFHINKNLTADIDNIYSDPLTDREINKMNMDALVIKQFVNKQKKES